MREVKVGVLVGLISGLATVGGAMAGGFDTGQQNVDLLFDSSDYVFNSEVQATGFRLNYDKVTSPLTAGGIASSSGQSGNFTMVVPRVDVKAGWGPVDCLGTYTEPFKASSSYDDLWAGATEQISKKLTVKEGSLTCSYAMDAGPGSLRFIGGLNYDYGNYTQEKFVGAAVPASLDMSDGGIGWRAGVGYDIPEYAMRASLMYYSDVALDAKGTISNLPVPGIGVLPTFDVKAERVYIPQAVELKLQSGVAPGWLVSGAVKWQDWSVWQDVDITATSGPIAGNTVTQLNQRFKDGWTVNLGVGHQLTDRLAVGAGVTWNEGTSTGYNEFTDNWTLSVGAKYALSENVELTAGLAGTLVTGGTKIAVDPTSDYSASWGDDFAVSGLLGLKAHF